MEKSTTPTKPSIKSLTDAAKADAESAKQANGGTVIAGPFEVGKLGTVAVVERTLGSSDKKYTYAEFSGSGRPSRIPLAAVGVLAEQMG